MTDNKDALSAFKRLCRYLPENLPYEAGKAMNGEMEDVRAALTASPSAGVDVERVREALEMAMQVGDQCSRGFLAKVHAACKEALQSLPDAQGWLPIDDWHEDIGNAFWAKFPVVEPYYSGTPLDRGWPGYHTHFIPMSIFNHLLDRDGKLKPQPAKDKSK